MQRVNATSGFVHAAMGKSAPVPLTVSKGCSLGAARGLAETGEEIHFVPRSVPHAMHRPCVYMCVCGVGGVSLWVHVRERTCKCVCACMYTCMHACMHACISAFMYASMHTCVHLCISLPLSLSLSLPLPLSVSLLLCHTNTRSRPFRPAPATPNPACRLHSRHRPRKDSTAKSPAKIPSSTAPADPPPASCPK